MALKNAHIDGVTNHHHHHHQQQSHQSHHPHQPHQLHQPHQQQQAYYHQQRPQYSSQHPHHVAAAAAYSNRHRVASAHSTSAEIKFYLKLTFYMHFLLYTLIVLKLSEDILDRADIFILELQELQIPKPHLWEWLYGMSFLVTPFALRAIRHNSIRAASMYHITIWLFSLGPILVAEIQYLPDFWQFCAEHELEKLQYVWRNLPLSVVFQAFAFVALQVHVCQVYYILKLRRMWTQSAINRLSVLQNQQQQQPQQHQQQQQQQQYQSSSVSKYSNALSPSGAPTTTTPAAATVSRQASVKKFQ